MINFAVDAFLFLSNLDLIKDRLTIRNGGADTVGPFIYQTSLFFTLCPTVFHCFPLFFTLFRLFFTLFRLFSTVFHCLYELIQSQVALEGWHVRFLLTFY